MFVESNVTKNTDTRRLTQQTAERPAARSAPASTRKRSLRIADSAVVIGLIASYATSGGAVGIHATVSLAFTAAVGWHFWLHRTRFKSVAKRLSKKRSGKSRRSAFITVLIAIELTMAIVFGIVAWLGPRSLSGPHAVLANILVAVTIIHVVLNLKQLKTLVRRRSITIEARFRGSADSAQRGYAAGAAAALTEGSVEVRFRQPVPLDRDLLTEAVSDEEIGVFSGSDLVMEVNQSDELSIDIPVDDDVIDAIFARGAVVSHDGQEHDHCFGCSLTRSDGLGIATRPVGATGVWGTTWTPDQSLPSTDGFVNDEIVWAALDCPGSFAASEPSNETSAHPKVPSLRAMTVQIREHVRVGEPFAILGWRVDRSDEAVECGVAIVDKARHVKAYAHLSYTSSRAPTSTIER